MIETLANAVGRPWVLCLEISTPTYTGRKRVRNRKSTSKEKIEEFCQKHHIHKLSLFGSVLRDDFRPESDVDVLVEFEIGQVVGFLRLGSMELELSEILGRKVDMRTPRELSRYFRQEVCNSAEVQYAKG